MCGIFGVIRLDKRPAAELRALVEKGVSLMRHRGPDAHGVEVVGPVALGHARLSIIDLSGGAQPMFSADRSGVVCFNGEVYNFKDLKAELEKAGRAFLTHSDTEAVLNGFLSWGPDAVSRFRGMFAFCAYDEKRNRVLLARDRLGKKPLYTVRKGNDLFFSSEIEPLYQTVGPFTLNLDGLDDYLYWQYMHAPRTIYNEVRALPPAHLIEIELDSGFVQERRYWNLTFKEDASLSIEEWGERLDKKLEEAVRIRLISDVPFGAFLSGGIDSSLVVSYMAKILEQPVKTFSIGFQEADFSELKYAEQVAKLNHTEHYTEIVQAESLALLPTLVRHYGQPFADSSAIPTYYVSRMARKYVKMALSGDGGDESFAGYWSYETVLRELYRDYVPGQLSVKRKLKRLAYAWFWKLRLMAGLGSELDKAYEIHCLTSHHFLPRDRKRLFRPGLKGVVKENYPERKALYDDGNEPILSRLQRLDTLAYLPYDILVKVDIASMANSLETRAPLLDQELIEMAATIPAKFKMLEEKRDGVVFYDKKHLLKNLAKKRYPASLIDRPKMGFGIPLGRWFATTLKNDVRKRLLGSEYLPRFFDLSEVQRLLDAHSETNDLSARLWNLLFLEEWMRSHPDALKGY